jgi:hypothetical protein
MRPNNGVRHLDVWTGAVLLFGVIAILLLFQDFGVPWDEGIQAEYGERVRRYFSSGFRDRSNEQLADLRFYGPLFELTAATLTAALGSDLFATRHLLAALAGLLGVLAVVRLGARVGGSLAVPVFATLALISAPRFFGHAFVNSKDVPFAAAFAWAVLAFLLFWSNRPPARRHVLGLTMALGVLLAVRPAGILLLAPVMLAVISYDVVRATRRGAEVGAVLPRSRLATLGLIAVGAWLLMVLPWPWVHASPLLRPVQAVAYGIGFPVSYPVLFAGETVPSSALPWHYVVSYVGITTPLAVLGLALLGLARSVGDQIRTPDRETSAAWAGLQAWLLFPLLFAALLRPNTYDGVRHFLFLLPAIALFAGRGAEALIQLRTSRAWRLGVGTGLVVALALPVRDMVRLHPYESTYFNGLVGGVEGAVGRYETDYWVLSYREAMEWVNRQAGDRNEPVRVLVAANELSRTSAEAFAGDGIVLETTFETDLAGRLPEVFDFYVGTTRYGMDRNYPDTPVVHAVGRAGAVYTVIRGADEAP